MTQHHLHYVDTPLNVTITNSVAKISFGVFSPESNADAERLMTVHTIAMPVDVYLSYLNGMLLLLKDKGMKENIAEGAKKILKQLEE